MNKNGNVIFLADYHEDKAKRATRRELAEIFERMAAFNGITETMAYDSILDIRAAIDELREFIDEEDKKRLFEAEKVMALARLNLKKASRLLSEIHANYGPKIGL